jgi:tetratricopeptide (TPR) repeat protein/TolB-like protein
MIKSLTTANSRPEPSNVFWAGTDRLDSWKEIAAYLRREVRTVQLWEKQEGLPVHRHFHKRLGSVFAFRSEIDNWRRRVSHDDHEQRQIEATTSQPGDQITICILPLKNLSVRKERRQLCEVVFARMIAALEQINPGRIRIVDSKLTVPAKQRTQAGISQGESIDYRLRWSFQDEGESMRFCVALLFAESEVVAWSHTHRCAPNDLNELPAFVADQIVQCLWLKIFSPAASATVVSHREKSSSREAYLKGRFFWNQRSQEGLRKAIRFFESAIHDDPDYALPYSGLADSLTLLSFYEIVSPAEVMPAARRAAQKAIALDPNLAEAHASLADVYLHFDRDWQAAEREYHRSIQCNPEYALGYHWYSNLLAARGQHEAAHMAIMHALEINPVSIITLVWAGVTAHLAHQFDKAIQHYQSALELDPHFIWAHMYMAQALEQKGNFKMALQEFETTSQLTGGSNCVKAMMAHAHAVAGDTVSAREILDQLNRALSHQCMPSYDIAATYAALGESRQMVAWLNRACRERNMKLFTLSQDPRFDPLRNCSAFKEIVGQMGLAPHSTARS